MHGAVAVMVAVHGPVAVIVATACALGGSEVGGSEVADSEVGGSEVGGSALGCSEVGGSELGGWDGRTMVPLALARRDADADDEGGAFATMMGAPRLSADRVAVSSWSCV